MAQSFGAQNTSGSATLSASPKAATTAGDLLVAVIRDRNTSASVPVVSVTDSTGETWSHAASVTGTQADGEIWYVANAASLSTSQAVKVTLGGTSASTSAIAFTVLDVTGASASPLDVTAINIGNTEPASTGTTATTAQASEIAIGDIGWNSSVTPSGQTAGYTTTAVQQSTVSGDAAGEQAAWQLLAATGAQSYSATLNSSTVAWTGAIATFRVGASTLQPAISGFAPTNGAVGTSVTINGTGFTGATGVAFNGTAATSYTVMSDSQISTTVPTGATTGPITVTTPTGTATSSTSFIVSASTVGPVILIQSPGVADPGWIPGDTNSAAGTSRVIETVNNQVGIYTTALTLLTQFSLSSLDNTLSGEYVTDPQIVWDPATHRFYYASVHQDSTGNWSVALGYSENATPVGASSFCHYFIPTGTADPDYPKLGGTKDFVLVGVNYYGSRNTSADLWMSKPGSAALTACPIAPKSGTSGNLAFTPVPARQIDPQTTGWILAAGYTGGTALTKYKVTKSLTGSPVFSTGSTIPVPAYGYPSDAPQSGSTTNISVALVGARLTQVIQAYDNRLGKTVLRTAHTIPGGAGDEVRWYEIDPSVNTAPLQVGNVTDANLYVYNGTISPDRVYRSSTAKNFGGNFVIDFTTSSASTDPADQMVSKLGANPLSTMTLVVQSPTPYNDGRWGDYSSAVPDPNASLVGVTGHVYMTNMWNDTTGLWQSENWEAQP